MCALDHASTASHVQSTIGGSTPESSRRPLPSSTVERKKGFCFLHFELREEYANLVARRNAVAALYANIDATEYYDFDGTKKTAFRPKDLTPAAALPPGVASFMDMQSSRKPPSQRQLTTIVHHEAALALLEDCRAADALRDAAGAEYTHREASRLISNSAAHANAVFRVLPTSTKLDSDEYLVMLQRKFGLFLSAAVHHFDALEEAGEAVSEEDRLGDHFQHNANHSTAHKWLVVNWRTAFAKASDNTVLMGDKVKGKALGGIRGVEQLLHPRLRLDRRGRDHTRRDQELLGHRQAEHQRPRLHLAQRPRLRLRQHRGAPQVQGAWLAATWARGRRALQPPQRLGLRQGQLRRLR